MTNSKVSTAHKFKVGDVIRIKRPKRYIRCGYPLDIDEVQYKLNDPYFSNIIRGALEDVTCKQLMGFTVKDFNVRHGRLLRAFAFAYCKDHAMGGRERRIHTQDIPELLGQEYTVNDTFRVVTGDYYSGCYSGDYDDWEGPSLENQKHHTILYLNALVPMPYQIPGPREGMRLCIEADNVEYVGPDPYKGFYCKYDGPR